MSYPSPEPRTITVPEIAQRPNIAKSRVYDMLDAKQIPALKTGAKGRNWLISRARYGQWEATFGDQAKSAAREDSER